MDTIDAYILVGGRSSRLGTDKALVAIDGRSLAQISIDVVKEALPASETTVVTGNETKFAILATALGVPFIFDLYEGRGPVGGLHAALADAQSRWIFLLACDYPFVSAELIRLLANEISAGAGAIIPEQHDGRLQPLCAFYNVNETKALVEDIIMRPRVPPPLHEIAAAIHPRIVKFEEYSHLSNSKDLFININTQGELDRARKIKRKLSPSEEL